MNKRLLKSLTAAFLSLCIIFSLPLSLFTVDAASPAAEGAAGTPFEIKIKQYTKAEAEKFDEEPPAYDDGGYLFGGWFLDEKREEPVISFDGIEAEYVYAKFVPADVLEVKAQISEYLGDGNVTDADGKASLRFLTSVDSRKYFDIGFHISYLYNGSTILGDLPASKIYYKMNTVSDDTAEYDITPGGEFRSAVSTYFAARNIVNIPQEYYNTAFSVNAYWITMDGTRVEGASKTFSIENNCIKEEVWVDAVNGTDACYYGTAANPYKSLEYAISNACKSEEDTVIHLASDLTVTKDYALNNVNGRTITVDGYKNESENYKITKNDGSHAFSVTGSGTVKFSNIEVEQRAFGAIIKVDSATTVNIENAVLTGAAADQYALINTMAAGALTVLNLKNVKAVINTTSAQPRWNTSAAIIRTGNDTAADAKNVEINLEGCNFDTSGATNHSGITIMKYTTATVNAVDTVIAAKDIFPINDNSADSVVNKTRCSLSVADWSDVIAIIGKTKYTSMASLISAINGTTIDITVDLLQDTVITSTGGVANELRPQADLTVDGNMHTLTYNCANNAIRTYTKRVFNFNSLIINHNGSGAALQIGESSTVNLNDVTVNAVNPPAGDKYKYGIINIVAANSAEVNLNLKNVTGVMRDASAGTADPAFIRTGNDGEEKTVRLTLDNCNIDTSGAVGRYGILVMNKTTCTVRLENGTEITTKDRLPIYSKSGDKTTVLKNGYKGSAADGRVGMIGNASYATFDALVTAVNASTGDITVEILNDAAFTAEKSLKPGGNITIDGNGHTLTSSSNNHALKLEKADITYSFKNTVFEHHNRGSIAQIYRASTVNFENCVINAVKPDSRYNYALINFTAAGSAVPKLTLNLTNVDVNMADTQNGLDGYSAFIRTGNQGEVKRVDVSLNGCNIDTSGAPGRSGIVMMSGTVGSVNISADTVITIKDVLPVRVLNSTADAVEVNENGYSWSIAEKEAKIGNDLYKNLVGAINVANKAAADTVIELCNDAVITGNGSNNLAYIGNSNAKITIKGNGHKITDTLGNNVFYINAAGAKVDFENIIFDHKSKGSLIQIAESAMVNVTDSDIIATEPDSQYNWAIINIAAEGTRAEATLALTSVNAIFADKANTNSDKAFIRTGNGGQKKKVKIILNGTVVDASGALGRYGINVMNGTSSSIEIRNNSKILTCRDYAAVNSHSNDANLILDGTQDLKSFKSAEIADTVNGIESDRIFEYTNAVFLTSDFHYTTNNKNDSGNPSLAAGDTFGYTQSQKAQFVIDDIKSLQASRPLDAVMFLGDLSLDDCGYRNLSVSYAQKFKTDYISQLGDLSSYVIAGNHDSYTNAEWKNFFGSDRQYSVTVGNAAFIMLDTFEAAAAESASGSEYKGIDTEWLKSELNKCKAKYIFLCAHYISPETLSDSEFINILNSDKRIICMFDGHTHKNKLTNPAAAKISQAHINIGGYGYQCIQDEKNNWIFDKFSEDYAWGYNVLEWGDAGAHIYHIKPARTYTDYDGKVISYAGAVENELFIKF